MTTPNAMPKKLNIIHQQILGALIRKVPTSWTHRAIDPKSPDRNKPQFIETKRSGQEIPSTTRAEFRVKDVKRGADGVYRHKTVVVDVPVPTLAGNVSELSVERAAKRWIA